MTRKLKKEDLEIINKKEAIRKAEPSGDEALTKKKHKCGNNYKKHVYWTIIPEAPKFYSFSPIEDSSFGR